MAIERDYAGKLIRESEERFRAVFDSAPSAIYVKHLGGSYQFVNRATAEMFGVAQADWGGKRAHELLPPPIAEQCDRNERAALDSQETVEHRMIGQLPCGREATILASHSVLRHADGTPYAICGILRDISELAAAQREFERLWLDAPEPLCVAGFDGYFKRVNPAWTKLLGWPESELLSRPWSDFVHPEDLVQTLHVGREMIAGRPVHRFVNRYRCKNGSYRWFSWEAIPLLSERTIYGFIRDITEERDLEEQFRQAQKMEAIGHLASGVAHDFNNLLTVINGYAEILLSGLQSSDPLRDPLTQVREAGQRATELTTQLLAFSRKAVIEPKILDVNQVVESSARMLRRLVGENVNLVTELSPLPLVRIDPVQLEQVFMNLALNARDAMPSGGRLTIHTQTVNRLIGMPLASGNIGTGTYALVIVSDNGTGIPPEVKARIFEPFFTTKGPGKGTGLGLSTVYGIIRQAGGDITVESMPGAGTTFHITLPAVNQAVTEPVSAKMTVAPRGSETVLIAEDEAGVRNVVSAVLKNHGYKVLVAETAEDAIRVASNHPSPISLLLTDLVMPERSGRELATFVRDLRPGYECST